MGLNRLNQLYRAVILDHSKIPKNKGSLDQPDATMELKNPSCGDVISIQLKLNNNVVEDIKFNGHGCSISIASASMMTQAIKGKTLEEVKELYTTFSELVQGNNPPEAKKLGDAMMLEGVCQFPTRIRCATISWKAMNKALMTQGEGLDEHLSEDMNDEEKE